MATLYLHIGTAKTGTTAIQHYCVQNRRALKKRGYCFPRATFFNPRITGERNAFFLMEDARNPDGSFASPKGEANWRRHMRFIAALFRRYPNVILSDEGLWNSRVAFRGVWRDLKAEADARGYQVRIIVYLRRQDQFLSSLWAQKLRYPPELGVEYTWEDMLAQADDKVRLDYHAALEEIAGYFGRENITVRIYDRQRFPQGNIIADFLELLGLPIDEKLDALKSSNPSLYGNAMEIVRLIDALPRIRPEQQRAAVSAAIACCAAEGGAKRPTMFSPDECRAFLARYAESNRLLARDYFGDEDARLFSEPSDTDEKWELNPADMYQTIIRFLGIALFAPPKARLRTRLRRKLRGVRTRLWEWRKRHDAR